MYFYSNYDSPVGKLTIASNENSIVGLWIDNQRYYMDVLQGHKYQEKETEVIQLAEKWLDKYFNYNSIFRETSFLYSLGEMPYSFLKAR